MCSQVRSETMSGCGEGSSVSRVQLSSCLKLLWRSGEAGMGRTVVFLFSERDRPLCCPWLYVCCVQSPGFWATSSSAYTAFKLSSFKSAAAAAVWGCMCLCACVSVHVFVCMLGIYRNGLLVCFLISSPTSLHNFQYPKHLWPIKKLPAWTLVLVSYVSWSYYLSSISCNFYVMRWLR